MCQDFLVPSHLKTKAEKSLTACPRSRLSHGCAICTMAQGPTRRRTHTWLVLYLHRLDFLNGRPCVFTLHWATQPWSWSCPGPQALVLWVEIPSLPSPASPTPAFSSTPSPPTLYFPPTCSSPFYIKTWYIYCLILCSAPWRPRFDLCCTPHPVECLPHGQSFTKTCWMSEWMNEFGPGALRGEHT